MDSCTHNKRIYKRKKSEDMKKERKMQSQNFIGMHVYSFSIKFSMGKPKKIIKKNKYISIC